MKKRILSGLAAYIMLGPAACATVKVEPLEVKPIHIVMDVNVKIDKELADFFSDIDKGEKK